ncbi:hypothetical protein BU15DRAFT_69274 [Melanogaster broomeanus]|nr:hypothetical protein BU15DRAFT_69274 [Melanogaster broomeanus]
MKWSLEHVLVLAGLRSLGVAFLRLTFGSFIMTDYGLECEAGVTIQGGSVRIYPVDPTHHVPPTATILCLSTTLVFIPLSCGYPVKRYPFRAFSFLAFGAFHHIVPRFHLHDWSLGFDVEGVSVTVGPSEWSSVSPRAVCACTSVTETVQTMDWTHVPMYVSPRDCRDWAGRPEPWRIITFVQTRQLVTTTAGRFRLNLAGGFSVTSSLVGWVTGR